MLSDWWVLSTVLQMENETVNLSVAGITGDIFNLFLFKWKVSKIKVYLLFYKTVEPWQMSTKWGKKGCSNTLNEESNKILMRILYVSRKWKS